MKRTSGGRDASSQRNNWCDIGGDQSIHLFNEFPSSNNMIGTAANNKEARNAYLTPEWPRMSEFILINIEALGGYVVSNRILID